MRVLMNEYIKKWETDRPQEIKELTAKGIIPVNHDIEERSAKGEEVSPKDVAAFRPLLMGQAAGAITDVKPAKEIIEEMINGAIEALQHSTSLIKSKL